MTNKAGLKSRACLLQIIPRSSFIKTANTDWEQSLSQQTDKVIIIIANSANYSFLHPRRSLAFPPTYGFSSANAPSLTTLKAAIFLLGAKCEQASSKGIARAFTLFFCKSYNTTIIIHNKSSATSLLVTIPRCRSRSSSLFIYRRLEFIAANKQDYHHHGEQCQLFILTPT